MDKANLSSSLSENADMTDAATDATDTAEPVEAPQERYGHPVSYSRGQLVIHVPREQWRATAEALFADNWTMLTDITAVDFLEYKPARKLPAGESGARRTPEIGSPMIGQPVWADSSSTARRAASTRSGSAWMSGPTTMTPRCARSSAGTRATRWPT